MSSTSTTEGKRQARKSYRHSHHNSYYGKAPYPLSHDRSVLELESLDTRFFQYLRGSVSFVDFEEQPLRVLDLGCGSGSWVIEAAKEWPESRLVGFDLVDTQIPLKILGPSIASRIEWILGNFLTTNLPFAEDEFDYVHIRSVARAVPENKWGFVFEEVCRVLRPGGVIEVVEDDIIFPTFPRWFTNALRPLRGRAQSFGSESFVSNNSFSEILSTQTYTLPSHDHSLLESLHSAVYSNRFINMKPLSILPSYLTTYFRQVNLGPITNFPMPPLAPRRPLPQQNLQIDIGVSVSSTQPFPESLVSLLHSPVGGGSFATRATTGEPKPAISTLWTDITSQPLPNHFIIEKDHFSTESQLFDKQKIAGLSERSLAMQLYSSYQLVLACQEAMWEELKDRIRNRREELTYFGWDDDEELEEFPESRKKFEKLIERYQSDMQTRLSFWRSLEDVGWNFPPREPLTKAQIVEEERMREKLAEGSMQATKEDVMQVCRAMRVMIGYKP